MKLSNNIFRLYSGTSSFLAVIIGIIFFSCNNKFELPEAEESRLFLLGYVHPDSVFAIRLTHSFAPLDTFGTTPAYVNHAEVLVFENGILLDTLKEITTGFYRSSKDLKPEIGATYHFTAAAQGYPNVSTFPDSIPPILPVKEVVPTFTPVDYENAGTVNIQIDLGQPVKRNYIGIRLNYYLSSPFYNGYSDVCIGNKTLVCDRVSNQLYIDRFCLEDYYCVSELREITLFTPLFTFADGLLTHPSSLSLATYSQRSEDIIVKIGTANASYTNNYESNPFYSPIFIPIEVDGGYAAIIFYNTVSKTLQF